MAFAIYLDSHEADVRFQYLDWFSVHRSTPAPRIRDRYEYVARFLPIRSRSGRINSPHGNRHSIVFEHHRCGISLSQTLCVLANNFDRLSRAIEFGKLVDPYAAKRHRNRSDGIIAGAEIHGPVFLSRIFGTSACGYFERAFPNPIRNRNPTRLRWGEGGIRDKVSGSELRFIGKTLRIRNRQ